MRPNLKGQVALVTGAGRGIGRSVAIRIADLGAHVVLAARSKEQLEKVSEEIRAKNRLSSVFSTDVGDEKQVERLFNFIKKELGRLDILVNNAGIGRFGSLVDFPVESFDELYRVNLRGVFLCCQQAMRIMMRAKKGYIINISSVVGFKGYPNQSAYTATKHGVMGLTKSLAVEAQEYNIRVSVIMPGGVETDLAMIARPDLNPKILMSPEDIADAVEYLLSISDRAAVDEIYIRRKSSKPF
ncbi:MAG: hypothetical protein DRP54_04965 [Spirochaetes bacterium]|nr:MAG: hypothetical protein DRP54_04965 [Spirochaetota bacterium]